METKKTKPWRSRKYPAMRKPDTLGGTTKTETAGYVSGPQQIERLFNAGQILDNFRAKNYDGATTGDLPPMDPTRRRNYDLADASADLASIKARSKEQAAQIKAIEAEKKAEAENVTKVTEEKPKEE